MAKKYNLYDIPLKQSFANSGLTQRVPYQLNPQEDDLNWLEGFTDAYQRPVLADDTQQGNGRYIKMGQLNQVIQNLSQAILNVKQGLDNVSGNLDDKFQAQIDKVVADAEHALANPVITWLQTKNNQKCAGLKNFTSVNINNVKTTPTAVANLEWCNGLPLKTYMSLQQSLNSMDTTQTISRKNLLCIYYKKILLLRGGSDIGVIINNSKIAALDNWERKAGINTNIISFFVSHKDALMFSTGAFSYNGYSILGH